MPHPSIIDSHIHLWPPSAATPSSHTWMTPGHHLSRPYTPADYLSAISRSPSSSAVKGFIYVETDRAVADPTSGPLSHWAAEPLAELSHLRRLVEGTPYEGEGFSKDGKDGDLLRGVVAWCPMHVDLEKFILYIMVAKEIAGPEVWTRVKGFRYLLQAAKDEWEMRRLVLGEGWMACLRKVAEGGWSFDVGVDARQGGVWQLEVAGDMIERSYQGVEEGDRGRFIINHLCKPDLQGSSPTPWSAEQFLRWIAAIERMGKFKTVYMKLSGAFSELPNQDPEHPFTAEEVVARMRPWLKIVFDAFGPERIMFGSDWPVCNVGGPGDALSWECWRDAVERILEEFVPDDKGRERVWAGTAMEAYRLEPIQGTQ